MVVVYFWISNVSAIVAWHSGLVVATKALNCDEDQTTNRFSYVSFLVRIWGPVQVLLPLVKWKQIVKTQTWGDLQIHSFWFWAQWPWEHETLGNKVKLGLLGPVTIHTQRHPQEERNRLPQRLDPQTIRPRVLRLDKTCTLQGKGRSLWACQVLSGFVTF